jgi:solute carrier family 13 (sodium-dependent dicarboxylate transporter), member 2/3/5
MRDGGDEPAAASGGRAAGGGGALRRRLGLAAGAALAGGMLLAPAPAGLSDAGWRTAAVGVLLALWWMTEALPIPVVSLLPILLFPLLGVAPVGAAAAPYAHELIFLFLGGFLLARGIERRGLHRRIALAVVARVGTRPRRLVAGFMLASAFLSLWISNTATTMLMLPIALSLVALVERAGGGAAEERRRFALVLLLGIAYACSLGGMGTLIGTPGNALAAAFVADAYGRTIEFLDWLLVGLPLVALGLPLVHQVLTRLVFPLRLAEIPGGRAFLAAERDALGRMGPAERRVALVFAATAVAWLVRPFLATALPGLTDTGVALAGAVALFLLPAGEGEGEEREALLDWETARDLPWGVLLLFGGGLSLAQAERDTGLAEWIGGLLAGAGALPAPLVLALVLATILLLTELTSNTATVAAFLPVLASLAAATGQPPLPLLAGATLAASGAFMLPVATPPNAIVFASGHVSIAEMARAGCVLNVLFLLLVAAASWWLVPLALG